MSEIYFYHLTRTPLEATLPDLLEKCRARGWNVAVRGQDVKRLEWLDNHLWQGAQTAFLPHGLAGGEQDALQPVLLTQSCDNVNNAAIVMAIDGAEIDAGEVASYQRICVLFDGNDPAALEHARGQWKQLTDAGCAAVYWAQEESGWVKKVSKNKE